MESLIFHVDMDAFFAAVEQNDHPELKGKPVIVGSSENRGVVAACSYEARKFGVHSAMRGYEAKIKCPQGIFVSPNMGRYSQVSSQIMNLLNLFSPDVHQVSIDEAFLDMTGTARIFGTPLETGNKLKRKIREETGLDISVGIARNAFLAKMASDFNKPDGLFEVKPNAELRFIDKFSLKKIWGVGKKSSQLLEKKGYTSPAQIREIPLEQLQILFGNALGLFLYFSCRGQDPGIINKNIQNRSVSNETTFRHDINSLEIIKNRLLALSYQVMFRLFENNESGKTICLKIRYSNFETVSIQETQKRLIRTGEELYNLIVKLFMKKWKRGESIRLLGVGISSVMPFEALYEPEFFDDEREKKLKVEQSVFKIIKKGGRIQKASLLNKESK